MSLQDYGWNEFVENAWQDLSRTLAHDEPSWGIVNADTGVPAQDRLEPARVLSSGRGSVRRLMTGPGERWATVAGKLRLDPHAAGDVVVGDWVAARWADASTMRIEHALPRRGVLSRKAAGRRTEAQIVAAHLDLVILVMGLDGDFNLRRLERLLTLVEECGARPVILLNKCDLCPEAAQRAESVRRIVPRAPVLAGSSLLGDGIDAVRGTIAAGETAALMGSSGAGKSTLINRLLGRQEQATRAVRADGRGRHATTHRELFLLPGGGMLIDNPGIREVQLWASDDSLTLAFDDIAELAGACRYRDCAHDREPECAVRDAEASGALAPERLRSYRALRDEVRYLEIKQDAAAQREQRRQWKVVHRAMRRSGRHR